MTETQTYILSVNQKNGTVVIPKKARTKLNIGSTVYLKVAGDKATLEVPKYNLDEILHQLPPIKRKTKANYSQIVQEEAVKRFEKSGKAK